MPSGNPTAVSRADRLARPNSMRGLEMVRRRPIGPEQRLKWLLGATDGDVPRYGQVAAMR